MTARLSAVLEQAVATLGCDAGAILLREEEDWWVPYATKGLKHLRGTRVPRRLGLLSESALEASGSLVVDDTGHDPRFSFVEGGRFGMQSLVAVPLRVGERTAGLLLFGYQAQPVTFTPAEVDFSAKLAASISLAMENARLYEAERHIADTLQEALLTVPEEIGGADYGTLYRSATELSRVGGDFYDLFDLDDDRLVILIGDVSGKGLDAASLTSQVKNAIRIYAYERQSPGAILAKTNMFLVRVAKSSTFVTAFLAVVDWDKEELVYASAGHPPALLRQPSGRVVPLASGSTVLGVFPGEEYAEAHESLADDSMLLLYTDGAIEARGPEGELFGETRLQALLSELGDCTARELPARLFHRIMEFTGSRLDDDLALLALSLRKPAPRLGIPATDEEAIGRG